MLRPILIIIAVLAAVAGATGSEADDPKDLWPLYKERFVSADGRVIDHFQGANSHSEGQGYGLLLAALQRDREAFERLLQWTESNLQVRMDALSAWSWGKRPNGNWKIIDYNNATDGDLLIAFALLKAHQIWHHDPYREKALRIIKDIRSELAWEKDGYLVLAPAYYGFESDDGLIVNNGYMVFPALADFAAADEPQFWHRVYKDSLRLLKNSRFSRLQLPADWVILKNGNISIHRAQSTFFGYEAIRIPLYLSMAGEVGYLELFSGYLTFVKDLGYLPSRINLVDGSISADEAPAGFYAVFGQCARALGQENLARRLDDKAAAKLQTEPKDYFSFTLYLLAKGTL